MQTSVRGEDPGVVNRHHLIQKPHALQLLGANTLGTSHPPLLLSDIRGNRSREWWNYRWLPADALVAGRQALGRVACRRFQTGVRSVWHCICTWAWYLHARMRCGHYCTDVRPCFSGEVRRWGMGFNINKWFGDPRSCSCLLIVQGQRLQRVLPSMVFPPKVYQVRSLVVLSICLDCIHFIALTQLHTTVPGLSLRLRRLHPLRL